jgi:hypothetical protein
MSVITQLYFQIVEENNYVFRPFSGWATIRLRLEYLRKLIYCNVDIKKLYIATHLPKHCKTRSRSRILDVHTVIYEFSLIF